MSDGMVYGKGMGDVMNRRIFTKACKMNPHFSHSFTQLLEPWQPLTATRQETSEYSYEDLELPKSILSISTCILT